ncbi:MAG TPA: DUF302 domain-containing protein [Burkholderiales bacterium]
MRYLAALGLALAVSALAAGSGPTPGPVARYVTEGRFEDVRDDVRLAIQARGLVIDHESHVHEMLERTGRDVGARRPVFRAAEAFSFCSAVVSRRMLEADPHHVANCPYVIHVYALPHEPGRVYVSYRRPVAAGGDANALAEVEALLDGIVRDALGLP